MNALLKIKSVLVLLIATLSVNAQNEPFIKTPGGKPSIRTVEQVKNSLKLALQGKSDGVDTVNCTTENYTAIYTPLAINELLAAPADKIELAVSDGTELNNGINPVTKKTSPGGILEAGVPILKFTASNGEVVKIKYGSNGCYNPLGKLRTIATTRDNDERPATASGWGGALVINNNTPAPSGQPVIINNIIPGGNNDSKNNDISWRDGKKIYDEAQSDMAGIQNHTTNLASSWKNLMCCGGGGATQGNTISLGQIASTPQISAQPQVVVMRDGGGGNSFWATAGGTALGSFVGTLGANAINGGRRTQFIQQPIVIPQPIQTGYNLTNFNPYGVAPAVSGFYNETPFAGGYNTSSLSGVIPISGFQ